jgi:hypothetical protein
MKLKRVYKYLIIAGLALFLIGGLIIYRCYQSSNYLVYTLDKADTCTWQNGHVEGTTLVGSTSPLPTIKVRKTEVQAFLNKEAATNACAFPISSPSH